MRLVTAGSLATDGLHASDYAVRQSATELLVGLMQLQSPNSLRTPSTVELSTPPEDRLCLDGHIAWPY